MRKNQMTMLTFALLIVALAPIGADEQEPAGSEVLAERAGEFVRIKTIGGGEFQGTLLSLLPDRVEIINGEGQIVSLALSEIREVILIDPGAKNSGYFQDASANRLLVMPTAFGMEAGEFHIALQEFVVVTSAYGFSPNFSVWGGISIPGALLNARGSLDLGNAGAVSVGAFVGLLWTDFMGIVMPYTVYSTGDVNQNFTAGLALPVIFDIGFTIEGVVLTLAGKIVLSRTASIITENWIVLGSDAGRWDGTPVILFPAVAFRIAGSRFSWDIGATLPLIIDADHAGRVRFSGLVGVYIPLPLVSFTYRIR